MVRNAAVRRQGQATRLRLGPVWCFGPCWRFDLARIDHDELFGARDFFFSPLLDGMLGYALEPRSNRMKLDSGYRYSPLFAG